MSLQGDIPDGRPYLGDVMRNRSLRQEQGLINKAPFEVGVRSGTGLGVAAVFASGISLPNAAFAKSYDETLGTHPAAVTAPLLPGLNENDSSIPITSGVATQVSQSSFETGVPSQRAEDTRAAAATARPTSLTRMLSIDASSSTQFVTPTAEVTTHALPVLPGIQPVEPPIYAGVSAAQKKESFSQPLAPSGASLQEKAKPLEGLITPAMLPSTDTSAGVMLPTEHVVHVPGLLALVPSPEQDGSYSETVPSSAMVISAADLVTPKSPAFQPSLNTPQSEQQLVQPSQPSQPSTPLNLLNLTTASSSLGGLPVPQAVSEEDKAVPFVSPSIPPVEARIDGIIQLQDPRADVPQLLDESSSPGSIWGFELPSILTDALAPVTSFFESQDTSLAAGTTADSPKLDAIGRVTTPFGLVQQKVSAKNPEIATSSNKSEKKAPETARQSRVAYSKAAQDRAQHYLKMHITEQGEDSGKPFELFMKGTVKGPWCAGAATTVDVDIGHPFDAKKEAVWKDGRVVSVYWLMEAIKGEANSRVFSGDDFRARKLDNKILPMDYIAFAYPNGKPGAHVARFWKFTDTGFMTVDGNWDDRYGLVAHTWGDSWANRVYAVGMRFYGGESAPENKGGVKSSETPTTEKPTNTTNTDKPDEETDTQTQQVGKPVIDQPQVQIGPVPGSAVPTTFSVVPIVVGTDTTQETQETPETQVGSSNDKTVDAAVTLPAAPTEQTVEVTVPIMSTPTTTADLPDTLAES